MRTGPKSENGLKKAEFNDSLLRRFKAKCGTPDANGCIPWLGHKMKRGYGTIHVGSSTAQRSIKALPHRVSWVLANGDLAPEVCVLHRCDNRYCVNAEHLFLGTPKDNSDDMRRKNRQVFVQKINAIDVERIRDLRRLGNSQQKVADWLGISRGLISHIEGGRIRHAAHLFRA